MPALTRRTAMLSALSLVACGRAVAARESYVFDYHGWHVDASRASREPRETVVAAISRQLDIAENAAMAQDIRTFMRSVPIWVDPSRRDGSPAHYDRAKGVDVRVGELDPNKPLVLRELLRAFLEQRLSNGNADVVRFFEQARSTGVWTADAAMLSDVREFFATTAAVYLFRPVDGTPFSQGRLQQAQPEYWAWLGTTFDGFHGCE